LKPSKKSFKFAPIPPDPIHCYTVIDPSMTCDAMRLIVEIAMDDLERHNDFMTIKEICSIMDIICIASKATYARYIEAVKHGRSFGFNYDPLNLVPL